MDGDGGKFKCILLVHGSLVVGEKGCDGGGELDWFCCVPHPYSLRGVVNATLHAQDEGGDCSVLWVGETKAPFIGGHAADEMRMQRD